MSDQEESEKIAAPAETPSAKKNDSFNVPVSKSPWLIYALIQIPLVLFMVILLYVMYENRPGN